MIETVEYIGKTLVQEKTHSYCECDGCFFENKSDCPECEIGYNWQEDDSPKKSPWHTGTPTESGMYLVLTDEGYDVWEFNEDFKAWHLYFDKVKAWMLIPPYKEQI